LEQVDLPASALLGGRTDDREGDAELVGERREREPRARRGRRNDVVPARVTDARQRVVLRTDREMQRTRSRARDERGVEITDAGLDREPAVREYRGRPRARLRLLEAQLGTGVDAMAQIDERGLVLRDRRSGGVTGIHAG